MAKKKFEQSEMQVIMLDSRDCIQTSGDCSMVLPICPEVEACQQEHDDCSWEGVQW